MPMRTQRFTGYGVMLTADVGGDQNHPPVILMHGGGQTRHSSGKAARDLVKMGLYVISLDLRGHGESDWAPDSDTRDQSETFSADRVCSKSHRSTAPHPRPHVRHNHRSECDEVGHGAANGFFTVNRPSNTCPSCISSEYSVSQPATSAAAIMTESQCPIW